MCLVECISPKLWKFFTQEYPSFHIEGTKQFVLPEVNTAKHAPPSQLSSQEAPISFESFFSRYPHPNWGRPAFRLALDGWPKRLLLQISQLSSAEHVLIFETFLIIALESGSQPDFSSNLLFEIVIAG